MKNLYREYLYIPKDKHMSTKVFTTHVVLSVISVLACTLAMFATSYAWFSVEVSSEMNTIAAANFDAKIAEPASVMLLSMDDGEEPEYAADLTEDDEHLFLIEPLGTATTGYCRVTLTYDGQSEVYYTEQLPRESVMELKVTARKGTDIAFETFWGDLDDHGVDYDDRYGTVKPIVSTFRLRRSIRAEEGETIPGPRTPYLEYQFPQYATLEEVAEFYEISLEDILIFNGLESAEDIEIGDWINLPYVDEDAEIYVALPPDIEHEVMEGETVETIAVQYDISVQELIDYNGLEPVVEEPVLDGEMSEENTEPDEEIAYYEDVFGQRYVLTPGEILYIPFEVISGYTPTEVVYEEDLYFHEPGYIEDEIDGEAPEEESEIGEEPDGIFTDGEESPDESGEEEQPDTNGILSVEGWPEDGEEEEPQEEAPQEETPEEQGDGILTLD